MFLAGTSELVWLTTLLAAMAIVSISFPETGFFGLVVTFSLLLLAIMLLASVRQLQRLSATMWSALVWFRLGVALYVGFGTAVTAVLSNTSLNYIYGLYPYSDQEAMKFLLMTGLCTLVVLTIGRFFYVRVPSAPQQHGRGEKNTMLRIAIVFLIVGGLARYGILVPRWLGLMDVAIAGWVSSLAKLYSAGLFLLTLYTLQNSRSTLFIPVTLVAFDATLGLLIWDKSEIIFSLAFPYLAFLFSKFSIKRAIVGILVLFSIVYIAQPVVHYGRSVVGLGEAGSIAQRLAVIGDYFNASNLEAVTSNSGRDPLIRFSYVAPAAYFMNQYDEGAPGDAHEHALAALVPRILWPSKPNVGEAGLEAYTMLRGDTNSRTSLGMTHFAEAYWSFGWLGSLLVFVPGGLLLAFMSARSVKLMLNERWFQLPVVLLSAFMGYYVSGSWVPTIIGGFATYIVFSAVFLAVEAAFSRYLRPRSAPLAPLYEN